MHLKGVNVVVCKLYIFFKKLLLKHVLLTSGPSAVVSPLDRRGGLLGAPLLPLGPLPSALPSVHRVGLLNQECDLTFLPFKPLHLSFPHADPSLLILEQQCCSLGVTILPLLSSWLSPLFQTQPNVPSSGGCPETHCRGRLSG